jgi:hypothetical protein
MLKWILASIMVIHGLIHLMGGLTELGITEIEDISGKTLFSLSEATKKVLGVIWLLVVVLFVISAIGLLLDEAWWQILTIISLVISQILVVIWWPDAKFGTIANLLIAVGMVYE